MAQSNQHHHCQESSHQLEYNKPVDVNQSLPAEIYLDNDIMMVSPDS